MLIIILSKNPGGGLYPTIQKGNHMLDINDVVNVLDRRASNGASDESLISWLKQLESNAWRNRPKEIDGLIDAIKQIPSK